MSDISMCKNLNCPLRESCYRFLAEPSYYQTYAGFEYKDGDCDHYWPVTRPNENKEENLE